MDRSPDLVQHLKGTTSFELGKSFAWQTGYSAHSISKRALKKVRRYVENQKLHHGEKTTVEYYERIIELDEEEVGPGPHGTGPG